MGQNIILCNDWILNLVGKFNWARQPRKSKQRFGNYYMEILLANFEMGKDSDCSKCVSLLDLKKLNRRWAISQK